MDERLTIGDDRGPGLSVSSVRKTCGAAQSGLDLDLRAEFDEFGDGFRRQWRAGFARMSLAWNGNFHGWELMRTLALPAPEGS